MPRGRIANPNAPSNQRKTRLSCRVRPSFLAWINGLVVHAGDATATDMIERLAREEAARTGYRDGPER